MKPRVSHHYLPSPSKVYNNYLPTQEKITHQYSNNNNSNSNRYSSPQKHTPEKIHFKPIQSKRKVVTERNIERQNFIGKDTPIKGLENEEKVNLNAYGFGSTALKKNKSPSTQKLKIVSNIRKKN